MKILVQKYGGTSVATPDARAKACDKIIRAAQDGWRVVVVVSAIGREGEPYATDTLVKTLRDVDRTSPPAPREMDLLMACGEIISTVVMAQTLRARGLDTIALTGGQAGIATDYEFGNARILNIDPSYMARMLHAGRVVLVAGFQGVTEFGAITTLGRGGSDTTASAVGAALKPHADEVVVEIYTDVDGVKTADPRAVPQARTLDEATYEEVGEMAHQGAKVVHPRAAQIAGQYGIPLWVKSTFSDLPGTRIVSGDQISTDSARNRVTGVTATGKVAYLRFDLPLVEGEDTLQRESDKEQIEREIFRLLQRENVSLHLNSTSKDGFAFAIGRENLPRLRDLLDGLVVPIEWSKRTRPPFGRVYLLGMNTKKSGFEAQKAMLEKASGLIAVHVVEADVRENCSVVSVIASKFQGVPGVTARILRTLAGQNVPVYQTADSALSISVLIPEADVPKATLALHSDFGLEKEAEQIAISEKENGASAA